MILKITYQAEGIITDSLYCSSFLLEQKINEVIVTYFFQNISNQKTYSNLIRISCS